MLYTDGLVERRGISLDDRFQWLSELCRSDLHPEQRCQSIVDELTADGDLDDDVAFLVIEVTQPGPNG
jgi:hypothetical protein